MQEEYNATIKKQTNGEELCQIDKNIVLNIKSALKGKYFLQ